MGTDVQKTVEFDAKVYRPRAVKKAAYKFGDRLHFHIEPRVQKGSEVDGLRVTISLRQGGDLEFLTGEFRNEVLDQELREVVAEETRPVRDMLMAQAFSAFSLLDEEGDEGDYRKDPKGIRRGSDMRAGDAAAGEGA